MSVEEYSLKFTLLYKYVPSLVSNPKDEMSRFLTGVSNIVKEEWCTEILRGDITLSRLIMYTQSIKESNLRRRGTYVKRGRIDEQG